MEDSSLSWNVLDSQDEGSGTGGSTCRGPLGLGPVLATKIKHHTDLSLHTATPTSFPAALACECSLQPDLQDAALDCECSLQPDLQDAVLACECSLQPGLQDAALACKCSLQPDLQNAVLACKCSLQPGPQDAVLAYEEADPVHSCAVGMAGWEKLIGHGSFPWQTAMSKRMSGLTERYRQNLRGARLGVREMLCFANRVSGKWAAWFGNLRRTHFLGGCGAVGRAAPDRSHGKEPTRRPQRELHFFVATSGKHSAWLRGSLEGNLSTIKNVLFCELFPRTAWKE